jgi:hypothetical protein
MKKTKQKSAVGRAHIITYRFSTTFHYNKQLVINILNQFDVQNVPQSKMEPMNIRDLKPGLKNVNLLFVVLDVGKFELIKSCINLI